MFSTRMPPAHDAKSARGVTVGASPARRFPSFPHSRLHPSTQRAAFDRSAQIGAASRCALPAADRGCFSLSARAERTNSRAPFLAPPSVLPSRPVGLASAARRDTRPSLRAGTLRRRGSPPRRKVQTDKPLISSPTERSGDASNRSDQHPYRQATEHPEQAQGRLRPMRCHYSLRARRLS